MDYQNKDLDDLIKQDNKSGRGRGGFRGRGRPGNARGGAHNASDVARVKKPNGIFKKRNPNQNQGARPQQPQGQRAQNQNTQGRQAPGQQVDQNRQRIRRKLAMRRTLLNNKGQTQNNQNRPQQQNTGKPQQSTPKAGGQPKGPIAPKQAKKGTGPNGNKVQVGGKTLQLVQGTIAQRKIRVSNIDAKTVTNQDLNKLFSKCGQMIQARFDTNEFGQYLGTATIIYAKASAAQRAINDYNGASLDNRVMKVYFAEEQARPEPAQPAGFRGNTQQRAQLLKQERREKSLKVRRTGGRIQKQREGNREDTPMRGDKQRSRIERRRAARNRRNRGGERK